MQEFVETDYETKDIEIEQFINNLEILRNTMEDVKNILNRNDIPSREDISEIDEKMDNIYSNIYDSSLYILYESLVSIYSLRDDAGNLSIKKIMKNMFELSDKSLEEYVKFSKELNSGYYRSEPINIFNGITNLNILEDLKKYSNEMCNISISNITEITTIPEEDIKEYSEDISDTSLLFSDKYKYDVIKYHIMKNSRKAHNILYSYFIIFNYISILRNLISTDAFSVYFSTETDNVNFQQLSYVRSIIEYISEISEESYEEDSEEEYYEEIDTNLNDESKMNGDFNTYYNNEYDKCNRYEDYSEDYSEDEYVPSEVSECTEEYVSDDEDDFNIIDELNDDLFENDLNDINKNFQYKKFI